MIRGLSFSLLVHAVLLILVAVYGNRVTRAPLETMRVIPFHLVSAKSLERPQPDPAVAQPATVVKQDPESPRETPAKETVAPPKELPEKPQVKESPPKETPEIEKVAEALPDTSSSVVDEVPNEQSTETPGTFVSGPTVETTDSDFPFAWYLARIEGLIDRNWNPAQLGFGKRARISCAIHFEIGRSGLVSGAALVSGSGVGVYDRDALRAVTTTHLPPLPPQYSGARLGVTFIFNLEPES